MREVWITINDVPKIHQSYPTQEDYSLILPDNEIPILFFLNGIFLCLITRNPTTDKLQHCDKIFITPYIQS